MTTSLAPQRVVTGLPWHRGKAARHLLSLGDIRPELPSENAIALCGVLQPTVEFKALLLRPNT